MFNEMWHEYDIVEVYVIGAAVKPLTYISIKINVGIFLIKISIARIAE